LIALSFSCGGDDDSSMNNNDLIIGTWSLQSLDYSGTTSTTDTYGDTITADFAGEGKDITATVLQLHLRRIWTTCLQALRP